MPCVNVFSGNDFFPEDSGEVFRNRISRLVHRVNFISSSGNYKV